MAVALFLNTEFICTVLNLKFGDDFGKYLNYLSIQVICFTFTFDVFIYYVQSSCKF